MDCIRFVIQKVISKKIMDLNIKEMVFAIKIIDLDAEGFAEKIMVALIFKIDGSGIYTAITLMNQNTIVLLQIIILEFKI